MFPTLINPFGSNLISCSLTPPCEYAITGIPKLKLSSDTRPKASGSLDKENTILEIDIISVISFRLPTNEIFWFSPSFAT